MIQTFKNSEGFGFLVSKTDVRIPIQGLRQILYGILLAETL
jgi:hypothetical protein